MNIYQVIPLTRLPRASLQIASYYSTEDFKIGQLVEVPLGYRKVPAIIVQKDAAENKKQIIKKSAFALKRVEKELTPQAIFPKKFIKLGVSLADYYFISPGLMLQRMLPPFFSKPSKPLLKMLGSLTEPDIAPGQKKTEKILLISRHREKHYKKYIEKGGVLMLVPQYLQLAEAEKLFSPGSVGIIKSGLTQTKWRALWRNAYTGSLENIAGTRTALFTPFKNLRTIVVENENNTSHVSWDMHPKFDARQVAEKMSELYEANIIEGDIIPSIEKYHKAKEEKWKIISEKSELAPADIIDMREELKQGNFSLLSNEIKTLIKNIKKEEKVLMLISRKGLSSAIICRDCGYVVNCTDCDTPAILHQQAQNNLKLVCHRCGKKMPAPSACPDCKSHKIKEIGGGTQKAAEEIKKIAPGLSIEHIDSDIAKTPEQQEEIFNNFQNGETNILIGTQIALKEYMLPKLDRSIILMMDSVLYLPEYRSQEKIFEAIWRLRNITKKEVVVQTYHPDISVFKHAAGKTFEPFFEEELKKRKIFSWPPYSQLIKLTSSDKNSANAEQEALTLKKKLEAQLNYLEKNHAFEAASSGLQILGPAPAFVPRVAGKYIWYILIKWPKTKTGKVKNIATRNKLLSVVPPNWEVEVDPADIV